MKSKFSILFILIMSVLTAGSCMLASAGTEVYSEGGLTYTVNSDSTATVTGFSGAVIENLTIPETLGGHTVSKIGNNVFKGKGIQSLTLPKTVKTIEYNAFTSCTELKTIIFNEGLTELQGYAFSYCSSLSEITLPSTLKTVNSNGVFYNCTNLTKVNFAEGTETVPSYICYRATALEEVVLPESVTTIGGYAFSNCTSLKAINLNEGITELGGYVFSKCTSLTEMTFPSTLTKVSIYGAFGGCTNLKKVVFAEGTVNVADNVCYKAVAITDVVLPDTVAKIGEGAFKGCSSLECIDLPKSVSVIGSNAFSGCTSLKAIDLHEGITELGSYTFSNCTALTEVTFPSTLTTVGYYGAFSGCTGLTKVVFAEGTVKVVDNVCKSAAAVKEVVIPDTVTVIGNGALIGCSSLEGVNLPESVSVIGGSAFRNCTALQAIDLNEGITELGEYSFSGCKSLTEITFPSTLTTVGFYGAFSGCTSLEKVVFAEGTVKVANNVCESATAVKEVVLPESVTEIGYDAFFYCESLEIINLPESISVIGSKAFNGCTVLKEIDLHENVTELGANAFSNCVSLQAIDLPEGLTKLGDNAFSGCKSLTEVILPSTLTTVGFWGAFSGCTNLIKVIFAEGIVKIPDYVCKSASAVKEVTLPKTVTVIGNQAFCGCTALQAIDLHEGITKLGDNAFSNCSALQVIDLNEGITELGGYAFSNCTSLTEVTFPSTLTKVSIYGAFGGCTNLKKVVFAEGSVKIADNVCKGASAIEEIIMPKSVSVIGNTAFSGCTALKSIDLHEGIIQLGDDSGFVGGGVFSDCVSLTEIKFPSTLKKVSIYGIFPGCTNLKKVVFAEGTVKVADNACRYAPAITEVVIPDTVRTIGNNVFEKCVKITTIDLNKVETLGAYSFSECTGLSVITVPETLKYTTGSASPFNKCSNITSIIFEGSTIPSNFCCNMVSLHTVDMKIGLTAVGENAFSSVDNLKTFIIRDRSCAIPDTEGAIVSGATIYGYELSTAQEYADKYNRSFVALESSDSYEATVEYVRRQMINRNRYIILSYPQGAPKLNGNNDFVKFFDAVFAYDKADPAAGDNLRWSVKKINRAVLDDGYLVIDVDYYTTAEQESLLAGKLSEIAESLRLNDQPEYEKARLIFEYLCDNANAVSPNDKEYSDVHHSAYSVLVNNSGVCEGFSLTFYRLALEAGLDTRVVVSDKLLHACNIVKIADKWYYLDTYLAADEDDSSRGDVFYFLKSSVESQFSGEDYIAFTPDYETEGNWALTPAEIKAYSFAESDYIVDGGCGHILEFIGYSGQPCSGTGKEEYKCPKCGNEFSRNCKLEHTALSGSIRCQWCNKNLCKHEEQYRILVPERKATCTEDGLTSYEYCSRCEEHNFSNPELIPAKGHSDNDNDGICDQCGTTVGKKENSFIAIIKNFFGKISRFLAKLLGKIKK